MSEQQFKDEAVRVRRLREEWLKSKNYTSQAQIDALTTREQSLLEAAWGRYLAKVWIPSVITNQTKDAGVRG